MRACATLVLMAALAGCGSGTDAPAPGTGARLVIVDGDGQSGIVTDPIAPLRILVYGEDGAPAIHEEVQLSVIGAGRGPRYPVAHVRWDIHLGDLTTVVQTRNDGAARGAGFFGEIAGDLRIVALAPRLGLADTIRATAAAYPRSRAFVGPADSALYVGESYQMRIGVSDQYGNLRTTGGSTRQLIGDLSAARLEADDRVTALAYGRFGVVSSLVGCPGSGVTCVDTGWVNVVPRGTLSVAGYRDDGDVAVVNTNGTGWRVILPSGEATMEAMTAWSSTGTEIAFHHGSGPYGNVFVTDLQGNKRLLVPVPENPVEQRSPAYSADGQWIYYAGNTKTERGDISLPHLWRSRTDGSGREAIFPWRENWSWYPSPSPDGSKLLYAARGPFPGGEEFVLFIRDLATGEEQSLHVPAIIGAWSPDSATIAYLTWNGEDLTPLRGKLRLINADGSGDRPLGPPDAEYEPAISWSPDGQWIVVHGALERGPEQLEVYNVATMQRLLLGAWSHGLNGASWKPVP